MQGMPPQQEFVALKPRAVIQERGGFFGLVLFIVSAFSLLGTMMLTLGGAAIAERLSKHHGPALVIPAQLLKLMIALSIAELICIGGTWMWKRWGIYGYFGVNALSILAAFKATGHMPTLGIVAVAVMAFAVFPRLHMFD
ncbi:MAG: hypothetical protein ABI461_04285 [Polyangiaceae bacterium]